MHGSWKRTCRNVLGKGYVAQHPEKQDCSFGVKGKEKGWKCAQWEHGLGFGA